MSRSALSIRYDDHEVLQQFFSRGGSLRMLASVDQNDMDLLYAYATQMYEAGEAEAARNFYFMLARIDHWNFDYWFSLGLCYQRLSQHEEAIFCFSRSGMIKVDDPRSSFFAGVSYRLLGNMEYARKALNAALKWCGERADYQDIRQSAAQLLAHCELEK